jgi:hypothetical protein
MQICGMSPPLENPLSNLSEMKPCDREFTCQISFPQAEAFGIISCLQKSGKKRHLKQNDRGAILASDHNKYG